MTETRENNRKTVRINLRVRPEFRTDLEALQAVLECDNMAETVRRMLGITLPLVRARKEGKELILRDPKTGDETLVLIC